MSESHYASKPWLTHYPASVSPSISAPAYASLADWISHASDEYSDRKAYTVCLPNGMDGFLTFEQIEKYSNAFAYFLRQELQLEKGDRVAIQMPNCLAYPVALFGILKAGLIVVNLNPLYTQSEILHTLQNSQAKCIVIIDMFAHKLNEIFFKTSLKHVVVNSVAEFFTSLKSALVFAKQKWVSRELHPLHFPFFKMSQVIKKHNRPDSVQPRPWMSFHHNKDIPQNPWVSLEDVACLQYTGGTTGKIKAAILTHRNLMSNMMQVKEFGRNLIGETQEHLMTVLPLYHIFSFTVNCLTGYVSGFHNILIPSPRPISNLKKPFEKYPVTWMCGVNTVFHALTKEPWFLKNPPRTMKLAIAGGMPLLSATARAWRELVPGIILEGYGLTETSPALIFNPIVNPTNAVIRENSIGIPICSTDIKIVDDAGLEVPVGSPGELCARGPQVMQGYWKSPEETKLALQGEWFYTGDIAVMEPDGYFKIVDRKKDMILVSGFNVFPNEVEDCIQQIPAVLECAVVGVLDAERGEAVKAFIVSTDPSLTMEDVITHCRKFITAYKVPKFVEFRLDLPKSPIGKILKKELRTPPGGVA